MFSKSMTRFCGLHLQTNQLQDQGQTIMKLIDFSVFLTFPESFGCDMSQLRGT